MLNIHQELDRLLRRTEAAEIHREEFRGSEAMRLAESDDSYPRVVGALPPPSSHMLDASRNPTKRALFRRSEPTDPGVRWRVPRWTCVSPRSEPRSSRRTEQTVGTGLSPILHVGDQKIRR
jgi:hypothetical protein